MTAAERQHRRRIRKKELGLTQPPRGKLMLTERQVTLCRVAIFLRMDTIRERGEPALYEEHKAILNELWKLRLALRQRELVKRLGECDGDD